jgi:hypothetical protein
MMADGMDSGHEDGRVGDMGDGGKGHPAGLNLPSFSSLLFLAYLFC